MRLPVNKALLLLVLTMAFAGRMAAQYTLPEPLRLPPNLEQVLPLNKTASYIGDAIRIADCPEDKYAPFGTCTNVLFGGPALYDSHLTGIVQIRFYPPVKDIAHFEITHPGNLKGDSTILKAPQLFEYPMEEIFVLDDLIEISSGNLNLRTGEVTDLDYRILVFNPFYTALGDVNPKLAAGAFQFPGLLGYTRLQFTQRADGLLDVTFDAQTFLPLSNNIQGDPVRVPMPFCGPLMQCGSIQAPGSSIHPHIHFTTKPVSYPDCGTNCPQIPQNTIVELPLHSRNTTVGDTLNLNIQDLGGVSQNGFSHLQGRLHIQFGQESGGTIPFMAQLVPPASLLAKPPASPLADFGITIGPTGNDFLLKFPKQTYQIKDTVVVDDPFDISVGAIDAKTGKVVGGFLHRSFVSHNLLQTILTLNLGNLPIQSFAYWGSASFDKGRSGEMVFRFAGDYHFDLTGIRFPSPDLTSAHAYLAGEGSTQDQILRLQGIAVPPATSTSGIVKSGSGSNVLSGFGERFTYIFSIPCNLPGQTGTFSYTNLALNGTFQMQNLAAVSCTRALESTALNDFDTINFTAFGTWSKDSNPHLATVNIALTPGKEYVSIQLDGGLLSDVDTPLSEVPLP
ncbi:MAG: hypothetical protein A3F68_13450 [Acidobacteria bacterium RIFCSPLOWO2_12_FULL_54_10]|nr:MAG: hypothetical protein A3F68_13450 [Acidobacteria bacterium RIFCSPLOWO2_12_FULL_54_10]